MNVGYCISFLKASLHTHFCVPRHGVRLYMRGILALRVATAQLKSR